MSKNDSEEELLSQPDNGDSCQKPFSLEGVDLKVDSRCKSILDLLK